MPGAIATEAPTSAPGEVMPLVSLTNLSMTFGSVAALRGVDLSIAPGQVHGLLGENGSGKSTLIKILSGAYVPDPGSTLTVRDRRIALPIAPGYFRQLGISFVHQDLALIPELTVTENLRVSTIVAGRGPFIGWRRERRAAAELFERFGVPLNPAATVDTLNNTQRALVAIMRAVNELGPHRTLLVLDEPTVFLPKEDSDLLFRVVRDLVADGSMSALLVSHDLSEVAEYTDRVTVLRGGVVQGSVDTVTTSTDALVQLIVGHELTPARVRPEAIEGDARPASVAVETLTSEHLHGISFEVSTGEIVGITGLAGSGFEDVLAALYGALPVSAGTLTLNGSTHPIADANPRLSIARGIVYVPADRKAEGGVGELSVEQNITLPALPDFRRWFGLSAAATRDRADDLAEHFDIRPRNTRALFSTLSGGNQQKAVLAKWMQTEPRLALLQEPTQGVDIGARANIFALLREQADRGIPVVCASSDYDQLAAVCDRVIVLAAGNLHAELTGDAVTRENIASAVIASLAGSAAEEPAAPTPATSTSPAPTAPTSTAPTSTPPTPAAPIFTAPTPVPATSTPAKESAR